MLPATSAESAPIRLLLVDDHRVVREAFAALLGLQADLRVVGQAGGGLEAVRLHRSLQPDVTLMDLNLPDIDGVEAIRAIRAEFPLARIAVLTTYDNDERILAALRSGAQTYLIKTVSPSELNRAIRELAAGRSKPNFAIQRSAERAEREPMSERELDVLRKMAAGERNEAIAEHLGISVNTVKSHVRAVLRKLNVETRTEAVAQAVARNIVTAPKR